MAPRRSTLRALLGFALGATLAIPLPAEAGWQSGPVARVRVEGRYDQNLMEGGGDGSSLLQPMFGWKLRDPTTDLQATYSADVISYMQGGPGRGGVNHRLRGDEQFQLDRRTVIAFSQGGERVYDPTSLSRPGVVRAAGTTTYGWGQADLIHKLTPRWTTGLRYRGEVSALEAPDSVDGAVHAPSAWADWAWTRRDTVGIQYRWQYFDAFSGGIDGSSQEPSLSYARMLGRYTRLEVEAGPAIYTEQGVTTAVPRGGVEFLHRTPRITIAAAYGRNLVGSTGFEGALWSDNLTGSVVWRISEPLRAGAAAGLFRNGRAPDDRAFVNGWASELSLEYALGRDWGTEVAWRRVAQMNLVEGEAVDLSRNIFAVGLTWQFNGGRLPR